MEIHHSPQTINIKLDPKAAATAAAAVEARVRQQEAEENSETEAAAAKAWIRQQDAEKEAAAKEAVWLRQIDAKRKSMSRANTIVFPSPASSSSLSNVAVDRGFADGQQGQAAGVGSWPGTLVPEKDKNPSPAKGEKPTPASKTSKASKDGAPPPGEPEAVGEEEHVWGPPEKKSLFDSLKGMMVLQARESVKTLKEKFSPGKEVGDGNEPSEVEGGPKTGSRQKTALETRGPCGRCGLPVLTSHLRYVAGGCYYHQVLLPDYPSRAPLRACVCLLCGPFRSLV